MVSVHARLIVILLGSGGCGLPVAPVVLTCQHSYGDVSVVSVVFSYAASFIYGCAFCSQLSAEVRSP